MRAAFSPNSSTVPVDGQKPPMAFIRVDLPAPLVPISPTISPSATWIEAPSTARMPPKCDARCSCGPEGRDALGQRARGPRLGGRGRRASPSAGGRAEAILHPADDRGPGGVADLDQAAGEVEEQDEQADARGEQRDEVVVGEERRQPDDPGRAEHRAGHRAQAADDHDGDQHERVADREDAVAGHRLQVGGQQRAADRGQAPGRGRRPAASSGSSRPCRPRRCPGCRGPRSSPARCRSPAGGTPGRWPATRTTRVT